jgi:hypothetical protein
MVSKIKNMIYLTLFFNQMSILLKLVKLLMVETLVIQLIYILNVVKFEIQDYDSMIKTLVGE